jgi:hypothetical protein
MRWRSISVFPASRKTTPFSYVAKGGEEIFVAESCRSVQAMGAPLYLLRLQLDVADLPGDDPRQLRDALDAAYPLVRAELAARVVQDVLYKRYVWHASGTGAAHLSHALRAAYWLVSAEAACGQGLRASEVILPSALGTMILVGRSDRMTARIGALGEVACRLV